MSNFVTNSRTNYFRVADLDALIESLKPFALRVEPHSRKPEFVCIEPEEGEESWPLSDRDNEVDFVFEDHVCPYIAAGSVLVWSEVGADSFSLGGSTVAYTSQGEVAAVRLTDIYRLAAEATGIAREEISVAEGNSLPSSEEELVQRESEGGP